MGSVRCRADGFATRLQAEEADGVETVEGASASKKESETEFGREAQRG